MELTSVFSNEYVQVHSNQEKRHVQVTWLKQPPSEVFREVQTSTLEHALQQHLTLWLCDMREMAYLEIADQNWLAREIFAFFDPGYQHEIAYVINTAGLELMTSMRIREMVVNDPKLHEKLQVEIFFEKELAQQWLIDLNYIWH